MAGMTRWDPIREMMTLRRAMDRMFEDPFFNQQGEWEQQVSWNLAVDVAENQDEYLVKASLPGINPDDIEITYNNNILTIRGEIKEEEERKGETYHLRERRFGSFNRTLSLPTPIKPDAIEARYDAGVLTLRVPKTEEVKPKRIEVRSGQRQQAIEGRSTAVKAK
jgi:HSP20 family protein